MIPAKLQNLIDKFYAGKTTEHEEEQLRAYFTITDDAKEFSVDKAYFRTTDSMKREELGTEFEPDLFDKINTKQTSGKFTIWRYSLSGVAATIAVFLVLWFGTDLMQPEKIYGTIHDPHLAFSETQKVLEEVSKKMKKGLGPAKESVSKVEENVNRTNEVKRIKKALEKTKPIQKIEEASDLLKSFSKVYVNYGKS